MNLGYSNLLPEKRKKISTREAGGFEEALDSFERLRRGKRLGRGRSSGKGKTSARGQKGQKSRSGYSRTAGFEGGQMPLHRRLPKRGFTNIHKKMYQIVNLSVLDKLGSATIDSRLLYEKGLIHDYHKPVKLLGDGEVKNNVTIYVDRASKTAIQRIESAGGKVIVKEVAPQENSGATDQENSAEASE